MTIEQLRQTLRAQPFRPFSACLADGRSYRVPHSEFVAPHPGGRTAVVFHDDGACSIVDIILITELRIESAAAAPTA